MSHPSLQILLISGSPEPQSRTGATLAFLVQLLHVSGISTYTWDLHADPLPLFDPHYYADPLRHPCEAVRRLAAQAQQASGFIWGSPIYHNSFSGLLKNALDSLSRQQFCHKPVVLVSSASNERTGSQACDQLYLVARGLHALALPTQLITLPQDFICTQGQYRLHDQLIQERATRLVEELLAYVTLLRPLYQSSLEWDLSHAEAWEERYVRIMS
jgi:NAD(P)H-dependent FMN reductase